MFNQRNLLLLFALLLALLGQSAAAPAQAGYYPQCVELPGTGGFSMKFRHKQEIGEWRLICKYHWTLRPWNPNENTVSFCYLANPYQIVLRGKRTQTGGIKCVFRYDQVNVCTGCPPLPRTEGQ